MPTQKQPPIPMPIESLEHQDKRANIPTGQQAHLVEHQEQVTPELRYPRNPSLDPQLVWTGKDELDGDDLVVPAVPIYIQEKIDPRAIIENLRNTAAADQPEPELRLFDDFDGFEDLDPIDKIDFYQHEGAWQNRMILGDSLVVMASLAEKENLRGKVQMVFMDPPYGIKFGSNWQVSTRQRTVDDGKVADASREPEVVKAFRDTWELGIHSYLTYLRDRVQIARDLLTETGSIFIQIGDENVHLVRSILDEIFGSENFVSLISFKKTAGATSAYLAGTTDYIVWYAKDHSCAKYRRLMRPKSLTDAVSSNYTSVELSDGSRRRLTKAERDNTELIPPDSRVFRNQILTSARVRESRSGYFPVEIEGVEYFPSGQREWSTNAAGMRRLVAARRVAASGRSLSYIRYFDDFPVTPLTNFWDDTQSGSGMDKVYVVQTNTKVIERCVLMTTDPGDLVLDPTCGSGTTAVVSEQWGRRWITTDTSRVALALARTRLMSRRFPFYQLADEGRTGDVARGFVYESAPHVMLRTIAREADIELGMSGNQIQKAIARVAQSEILYDRPRTDTTRVRVTGRFTVESLSPHRVLDERPDDDVIASDPEVAQFETMILDNLRKAGVQNTFKGEKLAFDRLEPLSGGEWVQAEGEYTDDDAATRRVAVSIGPEFGTVGSEQVALAAQEATRGIPFDVLLVTGFAFDPNAWAKAKEINPDVAERSLGRLRVLLVRANPDLSMGDDLLKKTGAGNLFMVFGEPDIDITDADGEVTVEVKGLDVYDPTTGQVRSASTADIAAWFIDTNYDGTSFFVRHAYFTGGHKPYESLAKTLRTEIEPDAWASLYSTTSRRFPHPETGRIAVKVINHYGDEVMQVYELDAD